MGRLSRELNRNLSHQRHAHVWPASQVIQTLRLQHRHNGIDVVVYVSPSMSPLSFSELASENVSATALEWRRHGAPHPRRADEADGVSEDLQKLRVTIPN